MKRSMLTSIAASAVLSLSASAFAASPSEESPPDESPIMLSAAQMDDVTAGASLNLLGFLQLNIAPVVVTQIRVLNLEMSVNWTDVIQQAVRRRF